MFAIYMPHQNLGCLGVQLGSFYADLYFSGSRPFMYVNWFKRARYTMGVWFIRKWR